MGMGSKTDGRLPSNPIHTNFGLQSPTLMHDSKLMHRARSLLYAFDTPLISIIDLISRKPTGRHSFFSIPYFGTLDPRVQHLPHFSPCTPTVAPPGQFAVNFWPTDHMFLFISTFILRAFTYPFSFVAGVSGLYPVLMSGCHLL